jgi:hypothetical protein
MDASILARPPDPQTRAIISTNENNQNIIETGKSVRFAAATAKPPVHGGGLSMLKR